MSELKPDNVETIADMLAEADVFPEDLLVAATYDVELEGREIYGNGLGSSEFLPGQRVYDMRMATKDCVEIEITIRREA